MRQVEEANNDAFRTRSICYEDLEKLCLVLLAR